jgi:hypothetical protein
MIIDLTDLPVMWITCDKTVVKREPGMLDAMKKLKVSNPQKIDCALTTPYHVGLAMGHVKALLRHPAPFLIVEDDARLIPENPLNCFEVPDNTDALYLGTTTFGRWKGATSNGCVIASDFSPDHFRIYNMLSFHGICYLSQRYVKHSVKVLNDYCQNPVGGCDDPVADTMHRYNVLCLKKPIFFQDDGRANQCTQEPLTPTFT